MDKGFRWESNCIATVDYGSGGDLIVSELENSVRSLTPDQIIQELKRLGGVNFPDNQISRLNHSLQAATRAYRDGADIDWVVCTLLHDIGDSLAPGNHDRFSAEVVRPYVREETTWVVEHHGIFQMADKADRYGWDSDSLERYRQHVYFDSCREFSERWDQVSFNQDYPAFSLDFFEPMIREVFAREPFAPKHIQAGVVKGLPPATS